MQGGIVLKGSNKMKILFDDPPRLAKEAHSEEEALDHYRCVRDDIRTFIKELPNLLNSGGKE